MPINTIVIVRETWDARDLVGDILTSEGKLDPAMLTTRFEPEDLNALEMALQLKSSHGGKVIALTIGATKNVDVLRECLYREIDEVYRVEESAKDLDTEETASLIASAVKKIGAYDLILSGHDIAEGENSLLGIHVGAQLGIDTVSYVDTVKEIQDKKVVSKREISNGFEIIESQMPALLVVGVALLKDDPRTPRSAKATLKLKHKKTPIPVWSAGDIGAGDHVSKKTTQLAGYEAVKQRVIESKEVDPGSESALKAMLDEIRKGA